MVKIQNYDPYEIDIKFDVEEGDVTVKTGFADFGKDDVFFFSKEIKKGDYVALDTTSMTVKKATKADKIIGQVIDEPAFKGDRPKEDTTSGNYTRRVATVRLWGDYAHSVQLKAENKAIAMGDSVAYEGDNVFDKATTANTTIALETAEALKAPKVLVLFGYRGL